MERILITFCRFDFYIIKVCIHTKNYITFESLYPLKGITGDYFDDDENFFETSSAPVIKMFVSNVILAYTEFYNSANDFAGKLEERWSSENLDELRDLVSKYIATKYPFTEFKYLSSTTKAQFLEAHLNYFLHAQCPFQNIFVMDDDLKIVENCMKLALEQNISQVLSIHYEDNLYGGTKPSKNLDLSTCRFPDEMLLQEMLVCTYSAPRLDVDKNPFQYTDFFEERFNSFSEQKKMGLFLVCNSDRELFMYNKILTKFWINRY